MEKMLIRGGRVIDPANAIDRVMDVLIEEGKIKKQGTKEEVLPTILREESCPKGVTACE